MVFPVYLTRLMSTAELHNTSAPAGDFRNCCCGQPLLFQLFPFPVGITDLLSTEAFQFNIICINIYFILASNVVMPLRGDILMLCATGVKEVSRCLLCLICFQSDYSCSLQLLYLILPMPRSFYSISSLTFLDLNPKYIIIASLLVWSVSVSRIRKMPSD